MVRKALLVFGLCALSSLTAQAQDEDKVELFGGYSYMRFHGTRRCGVAPRDPLALDSSVIPSLQKLSVSGCSGLDDFEAKVCCFTFEIEDLALAMLFFV